MYHMSFSLSTKNIVVFAAKYTLMQMHIIRNLTLVETPSSVPFQDARLGGVVDRFKL